nr:PEP-CTERM sorting domain-containing protein [Pelomonas sp. P8]
MSQANTHIGLCSTDFRTRLPADFAEAVGVEDAAYAGSNTLTARPISRADQAGWAKIRIGLTTSADVYTPPVPEPSTALWLAGLPGVLARRRHTR